MDDSAIAAFNNLVISLDNNYDIITYVKNINDLSGNPIKDLSFMDELLSYIPVKQCNIPHKLLVKYGVLSDNNVSANVSIMLKQYNFIEGRDYLLLNVQEQVPSGTKHMKNYLLHPRTFKTCLMRAKNTMLYANYYILLEEAIYYYHQYQDMYKANVISQKNNVIRQRDDKIDELLIELRQYREVASNQLKEMKAQTQVMVSQSEKLDTLIEHNDILAAEYVEQVEEAALAKVEKSKAVETRITEPPRESDNEMIIIVEQLFLSYNYYVIRGSERYAKTKFRTLTGVYYRHRNDHMSPHYAFVC